MKYEDIRFFEHQKLSRKLLLIVFIPINLLLLFGCYSQLIRGVAWGNNPASDAGIIIVTIIMLLITVAMLQVNMETIINREGINISVRLLPFFVITRTFYWVDISSVYIRKYSHAWEFGGWGIRHGIGSTAYIMSGNIGLQLILQNNKKVLIGINNHEKLFEVLQKLGKVE